jgi:hypothetical protein
VQGGVAVAQSGVRGRRCVSGDWGMRGCACVERHCQGSDAMWLLSHIQRQQPMWLRLLKKCDRGPLSSLNLTLVLHKALIC